MFALPRDHKVSALEKRKEFQDMAFRHMDSLYNTALKMTRNEVDAEDLVQDVYVRAYRFFDRFVRGTNFKAWIFKILTNTFINQYHKKTNRPYHVEFEKIKNIYENQDAQTYSSEGSAEKLDGSSYDMLFEDEIKDALEQLSEDFRMVVILADVESFSYKEIANIVGCPIGTVMSRLSRGRKQLQSYLRDFAIREGFISARSRKNS